MGKKITQKLISITLVIIMLFAYAGTLGIYAQEVYATDNSLELQGVKTNNANVEFDAYFASGNKKVHEAEGTIDGENSLIFTISVKNAGYLKNARVQFSGDSQNSKSNFSIKELTQENPAVAKVNVEERSIELNKINKNGQANVQVPICFDAQNVVSLNEFSKENKVYFTGTYMSEDGKEKQIKSEIKLKLNWTNNAEVSLNEQVIKYIPYSINNQNGVLLQTAIKSSIKNNALPVKEENIEVKVPTIANQKPISVRVIANTTNGTNGDKNAVAFTQDNYNYNAEQGMLTIKVGNKADENSNVSWQKNAEDEFLVTYIYPQTILENMPKEGNKISLQTKANIIAYSAKEINLNKEYKAEGTLKDNISDLVDFSLITNTDKLSKGYIYANYEAKEKIETQYEETIVANIADKALTDKLVLTANADNFVKDEKTKGSTTYKNTNYAYAKQLKIEKEIYDKFIGEDGYINIYKADVLLATIKAETLKDDVKDEEGKLVQGDLNISIENGYIVVNLSQFDVNELTLETSKLKAEGKFETIITKALKGEIGYGVSQMKDFAVLETLATGKALNENSQIVNAPLNKNIALVDPTTVAEFVTENTSLSTVVTNKNVELRAILKTNSLDYKLYKNPTVTFTLPSYIEKIDVKNVQVLFTDELKVKTANIIENKNGTKQIALEFEGTQTKYDIGNIAGGTNIVVTADIDVNKSTPNVKSEIKMNYTNANVLKNSAIEKGELIKEIEFVAPIGLVTQNSISGYKDNAEELVSISGEEKIAQVDILSKEKEATFNMSVMNNYKNTIQDVAILGRFPSKGNKAVTTSEDLGSTMDLNVTKPIAVSGIDESKMTVYYSENANATQDLNNSSNGWTTSTDNIQNARSYLIQTQNYTMNTADTIDFSYDAVIPANLQHNETSNETYAVFFTNNLAEGAVQDRQETARVGATTGQGPVFEASIKSDVESGNYALSGETIKYTVTVKNTGGDAENVKISMQNPQHTTYKAVENGAKYENGEQSYTVETLKAGETITRDFYVTVERLDNKGDTAQVTAKATVSYESEQSSIQTNEIDISIKNSNYETEVEVDNEKLVLNEKDEFEYSIDVRNIYETNDTVLEVNIPSELECTKIEEQITDDIREVDISRITNNNGKIQIKIDDAKIYLHLKVKETQEQSYNKKLTISAAVYANNTEIQKVDDIQIVVNKNALKISQTASIPSGSEISALENIVYKITIESIGNETENGIDVDIKDKFPKEMNFQEATMKVGNEDEIRLYGVSLDEETNELNISVRAKEGKTTVINIYANATSQTEDIQIANSAEATINGTQKLEINSISHTMKAVSEIGEEGEDEDQEDTEEPKQETRKISGQVWLDSNKDGVKEEEETKVENVEVMLYNTKTNNMQTNSKGEVIKAYTNSQGIYTLENVPQGTYTVIFVYNTGKFSSTTYKKDGVDEIKNSDAIDTQITLDNKNQVAAITEDIKLDNSNIYNIDLGLVENPKFDLKLDKVVSKITLQDSKGTKTYNYEDSKLAKRDIVGKQVSSTTVIIEYKLKITNEGAISGFAKKIADYIPNELKFSSELNKDWYQGENGTIYNSSLANTIINPGETKEVTLLLTKKLTDENLGLIQNNAEIYEAYNDLGISDIDSMPANKSSQEDDYSSADVLLTVKTGQTIAFVALSAGIISVITIGGYIIKKKVLK